MYRLVVFLIILGFSIAGMSYIRFRIAQFARRTMWRVQSQVFSECGLSENLRPQLMFVSREAYRAWQHDGEIPQAYFTVGAKYVRLHAALQKKWGEAGNMSHWLLGANTHFDGKSPVSFIIDGGESGLNGVLAYLEDQR